LRIFCKINRPHLGAGITFSPLVRFGQFLVRQMHKEEGSITSFGIINNGPSRKDGEKPYVKCNMSFENCETNRSCNRSLAFSKANNRVVSKVRKTQLENPQFGRTQGEIKKKPAK
jgi:hypothetical protein